MSDLDNKQFWDNLNSEQSLTVAKRLFVHIRRTMKLAGRVESRNTTRKTFDFQINLQVLAELPNVSRPDTEFGLSKNPELFVCEPSTRPP